MPIPFRTALPRRLPHPGLVVAAWLGALGCAGGAFAQGVEARIVQLQGDVRVNGAAARAGMVPLGATVVTGVDGRVQLRTAAGAVLALPAGSELRLGDSPRTLALAAGGLRLSTANAEWRVNLPDRSIRTNGYLKLQACGAGCALRPGLYGRIVQGEAVLEYQGGRSVLRTRSFRWADANTRPEVLPAQPALLDDLSNQAEATRVRAEVAATLKAGIEAFGANRDAEATQALERVRTLAPGETLVPYYLGLIALKREDNATALALLQQYTREDPEGAAARDVPKTMTLLSSAQLQQEVAAAVARESEVVSTPPEPGSIAVQAFVNKGNDAYRAMAKGLAAMVIADLSKVPGLKVLEREKVQLLVNEAKLGDSGLADTASAVRSGRLMRAEKVVVGNFEVQ
ncbi:MAG: CsgG/HfaB family protein [Rubrivivax sp.]|nr:CsgG/HfaB family protein [Rubrivivax sp.]